MTQHAQLHDSPASAADPLRSRRLERVAGWLLWVYWPLLAVMTHFPNLHVPGPPPHPLEEVLMVDKFAHAIAFGGLMLLVLLSGVGGRKQAWSMRCAVSLVICMIYATADELSQEWIDGRTVSVADLVTNYSAVLGVYLVARQPRFREQRRVSRLLLWPMILLTPVLIFALASTWAMRQASQLKHSILGAGGNVRLDYVAHGGIAFFVSVVVFAIWPTASKRPRRAALAALLLLLLSGPGVEIMQHFTGRGVQGEDVLGHTIGVLLAMVLWAIWPRRRSPVASVASAVDTPSFVGHAVLVSLFTLLSRFAGLARDAILAAALGLSVAADAFFIGFLVPNLFRRLFGEGALTAAFIPNYTDLLQRDPGLAKRFATLTLTLLSVLLISITLLGEFLLWWLAGTIDPDHKASLAIHYTRLMLPYMPLICAVALIGGVLQVHKRFGPPAAVPLVLNGVIVVAVLIATGMFERQTEPAIVATWVAVAVVIAGVLQLYWQAAVLFKVTGLSRSFKGCWPAMRSMLLLMGPMAIGLAVFQINALLDALIAFFFAPSVVPGLSLSDTASLNEKITLLGQTFDAPLRNGDVAALNWSQRLYQFPLGVFGIAIATAIFPALSAAAAKFNDDGTGERGAASAKPQANLDEFASIVRQGLRLTLFVGLPATAGLMLVRVPLARTVFEHGSFTTDDALRVSAILAGYASSVWAYSMTHTLTRAFYALKDAKTPLKVSAAMVLLNLTLNLSLIWSLGAAGLAWSTAISAALQVVLLVLLIRKRVDRPIDESVISSWTRTMIATTVMAAVLFAVLLRINPITLSWNESAGLLVGMVLLGMAVFFTIAKLTKAQELGWLRKRSVK